MLQKYDERNRNLIVNINGNLVHRDQAAVSPFDSAVQGGDAVWEGLRLYGDRIFKLTEHLDRLRSSALALAFAGIPPHEKIIDEIKRLVAGGREAIDVVDSLEEQRLRSRVLLNTVQLLLNTVHGTRLCRLASGTRASM